VKKPLRLALSWLAASSAFAAPLLARAESVFEGQWEGPFGRMKVEKSGDTFVGRLSEPGKACGWARGTEILRGHLDDEFFTGELRLCYAPACHADEWVFAMATSLKGPERITGAVGTTPHGCVNQNLRGAHGFTLSRPKPADTSPAPLPPPSTPTAKISMKPEAKKLFDEGVVYFGNSQFERALKKLKQAEDIDPRNPAILENIGTIYKMRNDLAQARSYYQQAIHADKTDGQIHYNLACVLALEGKTSQAMETLRTAIRYGFDDFKSLETDSDLASLRDVQGFDDIKRGAERNRNRGR